MEPAPQQEPDTSLQDLDALFTRLEEAKTHYEVMDVGRASDDKEIKRVYYSLARRFIRIFSDTTLTAISTEELRLHLPG